MQTEVIGYIEKKTGNFASGLAHDELDSVFDEKINLYNVFKNVMSAKKQFEKIGNSENNKSEQNLTGDIFLRKSKAGKSAFFFIGEIVYLIYEKDVNNPYIAIQKVIKE